MTHEEKRIYLIKWLLNENDEYRGMDIPDDEYNQKRLLRGLMNIRMPGDADPEFLKVQDEYLQEDLQERGIVDVTELPEIEPGICLWQGDITRLNADAIVDAANNMLRVASEPIIHALITVFTRSPVSSSGKLVMT